MDKKLIQKVVMINLNQGNKFSIDREDAKRYSGDLLFKLLTIPTLAHYRAGISLAVNMDRSRSLENINIMAPLLDLDSPLNYNPYKRITGNYIPGCPLHPDHEPIYDSTPVYMVEQFDPYHFDTYGRHRHSPR